MKKAEEVIKPKQLPDGNKKACPQLIGINNFSACPMTFTAILFPMTCSRCGTKFSPNLSY